MKFSENSLFVPLANLCARRNFFLCAAVAIGATAYAQHAALQSNLALLDSCARSIAVQAAKHFPTGGAAIYVDSTQDAFLLTGALLRAARDANAGDTGAKSECRAHVLAAGVSYNKTGAELVRRTARMNASFDVRDARSGKTLWANALEAQITDSIECGEIPSLESPDVAATHAPNPCGEEASAFSTVFEPLIFAAASATIILLLFTVRSQ